MTPPKNLRVVKAGEKPAAKPRKKHTVESAIGAEDADELDIQYAVQRRLAKAIDAECSARDLAALTKRLDDVSERIRVLEAAEEKEAADAHEAGDEAFDASAV